MKEHKLSERLAECISEKAKLKVEREKLIGICRMLVDAEKNNLVTLLESAVEAAREFLQGEEG